MTQAELENAKLEEIAAEFRAKGYEVSVRPRLEKLPEFLRPFQPDFIATSSHDNAIVEVKSTQDLMTGALVQLAEAVERQPGWRLELQVVSLPIAPELPENGELLPARRVESLLREARTLHQEKHYEAAAMMAWAAAEAVFRRMARARGVKAERKSSGTILKQLYIFGLIDDYEYLSFVSAMDFRDALSHGFKARVTPGKVRRFIQDVEEVKGRPAA
jgi:hypothetical protein